MKRILNTILLLAGCTLTSQAQTLKVYKIDYLSIAEGQTLDKNSSNFNLRAWVNDSFNKVVTNDEDNGAQILNKTNNKSFLLFAPSEEYHILEEENNDAYNSENENLPFELSSETKNIAGYPCKLAIVKIDPELDDEDNLIKIWYTDKIPVLYWGQFSFLKNIPGAALEVMIGKNGFKAVDINQENVPTNFFEIPETYTEFEMETEDEEVEDSSIVAYTQIDEDRFLYYDESETFLGLKDESDRQITKAEYGYFDYFKGGITTVIDAEGNFGSMDKNGNIKIPFKYDFLSYDEINQQYIYGIGEKYGILSATDQPIINAEYDMVSHMNKGYVSVNKDEKYGIVDKNGKLIVPITYPLIMEFNDEVFVTTDEDHYNLYNIKTNKPVSDDYDLIALSETDPVHLVQKGDNYGFIDNFGKVVIPIQFTAATNFDDGHASVETKDGEMIFINIKGEKVDIE